MATQIVLTTTGTNNWTVPADWNNASNSIEVIGAGGGGGADTATPRAGSGGGGGGYGKITNQTLTGTISYTIAAAAGFNTDAGDTFFNGASLAAAPVGSSGGKKGLDNYSGPKAGGAGGAGKGTVTYTGGAGGNIIAFANSGGGGGGSAGLNGNGVAGNPANGTNGGAGGAGDNGNGGAGGFYSNGGNGTEYVTVGSGGGGGGGFQGDDLVGNGGLYGGGGGGSAFRLGPYGGAGTQGLIVINYLATGARYWVGGTGTWDASATTHWSTSSGGSNGASAPNSLTTAVYFDANSGGGTCTTSGVLECIVFDTTGFTGAITHSGTSLTVSGNMVWTSSAKSLTVNSLLSVGGDFTTSLNTGVAINATTTVTGNFFIGSGGATLSGSAALNVGGNFTLYTGTTNNYGGTITFTSTSTGKTITTNGVQLQGPVIFNGVGGVWTLQDALFMGSYRLLTITNGTLDTGNYRLGTGAISNAGTLNLGSSVVNMYNSGAVWTNTGTINAGTSTILLGNTQTPASSTTFVGGSVTYYNLYLSGTQTGAFIIQGNNTFNDFKCDTPPHTIQFTAGSTQTLNTFTVNGTAGNLMTLQSTVTGQPWHLIKSPTGVVSCDYLSLKDSHVS